MSPFNFLFLKNFYDSIHENHNSQFLNGHFLVSVFCFAQDYAFQCMLVDVVVNLLFHFLKRNTFKNHNQCVFFLIFLPVFTNRN